MDTKQIDSLLASLPQARRLSPLELNAIRFSGRKTIITEARLKRVARKKSGKV